MYIAWLLTYFANHLVTLIHFTWKWASFTQFFKNGSNTNSETFFGTRNVRKLQRCTHVENNDSKLLHFFCSFSNHQRFENCHTLSRTPPSSSSLLWSRTLLLNEVPPRANTTNFTGGKVPLWFLVASPNIYLGSIWRIRNFKITWYPITHQNLVDNGLVFIQDYYDRWYY